MFSRADYICEIINAEKEYPWRVVDLPRGDVYISYSFMHNNDEYEIQTYYFKNDSSLDLNVFVNDRYSPGLFLVSPERIDQRSRGAIRCMSILFSLIAYAFSRYPIKRIDFDSHRWIGDREDPRFLTVLERFGRAIAKKYNGVYVRNQEYSRHHPTDFSIYFRGWRRTLRRFQARRRSADDD